MLKEVFWKDGFIFYLEKKSIDKDCLLVQMKIREEMESDKKSLQTMQIKINSNDPPDKLFESINRSFKEFSSKWIVSNALKEINFTITKTKKIIKKEKTIPLVLSSPSSKNLVAICAYCFFPILIVFSQKKSGKGEVEEQIENDLCEKCLSKHFLLENQFALVKVIAQGGFGRIFQAVHLKTGIIVAIKERKKDVQPFVSVWLKEVKTLHKIRKIDSLSHPRFLCTLDDTTRDLKNKFIVMEWVNGSSLKNFDRNSSKKFLFTELCFIRMALILLSQLEKLHQNNLLHRDIKTENIMYFENEKSIFFTLIDFGSTFKISSKKDKTETFSKPYSPPEQNTPQEHFGSDLYSLSVSLLEFLRSSKIEIRNDLRELLENMKIFEIYKRPSLEDCTNFLFEYLKKNYFECKIKEFGSFLETLKVPPITKNFEELSKFFENEKEEKELKRPHKHQPLKSEMDTNLQILVNQYEEKLSSKDEIIKEKDKQIKKLLRKLKNQN